MIVLKRKQTHWRKQMAKLTEIIFTEDSFVNSDLRKTFDFSYYTLCAIQDVICYVDVNPLTVLQWMKDHRYTKAILTMDHLGNFKSLTGVSLQ
jgi:hypothetical protein